jgi:hypothetical protein
MKKFLLLAAIFGMLCSPSQAKTWWNYEASCTVTDVQPTPAVPFETAGYTIRIAFDAKNPTKINNLQISPDADQTDFVDVLSRDYSKVKYWKDGKNIIWTGEPKFPNHPVTEKGTLRDSGGNSATYVVEMFDGGEKGSTIYSICRVEKLKS